MADLLKALTELLVFVRQCQQQCPIEPIYAPGGEIEALNSPCAQLPCVGAMFRYAGRQFRRGMLDVDGTTNPQ